MTWPPDLDALKADLRRTDALDDAALQIVLDAAVAEVVRVKAGELDFDGSAPTLPAPDASHVLGALRLAARWDKRRQSVDGLVTLADLGAGRVPSIDPDIERMLQVGRYAPIRFA